MDLRSAAAYLGCSYWTLRDLVLNGHIPAVRIPSPRARDGRVMRRILIDSRDLERLIELCLVGQVLPERPANQGVEPQQQGIRRDQSAEAPGRRHRARTAGEPEAESDSLP
jgi:excisionase family DNA binding protein